MSISLAPAATEARISASLLAIGVWPAGKPVDTAATGIPEPSRASTAVSTRLWYTHTAPTVMRSWSAPSRARTS